MVLDQEKIVQLLRERIPDLLGVYAYGSQIDGTARPDSDLDMAVLIAGKGDAEQLFNLSNEIADLAGVESVDLLDFRAVGTVMQHQIIMTGVRWWAADEQAGVYEAAVLSDMIELNCARAELLEEIIRSGRIYAR